MLASVVRFSITLFGNLLLYLLLLDSVGFKWATRIYSFLYVSCLVLALRLTYLDGFFDDGTPAAQAGDDDARSTSTAQAADDGDDGEGTTNLEDATQQPEKEE